MGNHRIKSPELSQIAKHQTEVIGEISIYDYQIENFMYNSLDSQNFITLHIVSNNKKYTIVEQNCTKIFAKLKNLNQIYYQDKLFINFDIPDKADPFLIITDYDFISCEKELIKIHTNIFQHQINEQQQQIYQSLRLIREKEHNNKYYTKEQRMSMIPKQQIKRQNTIEFMDRFVDEQKQIKNSYDINHLLQKSINLTQLEEETNQIYQKISKKNTLQDNYSQFEQINEEFLNYQQSIKLNKKRFQHSLIYKFYKLINIYGQKIDNYIEFTSKFEEDTHIEQEFKENSQKNFDFDEQTQHENNVIEQELLLSKLLKHINQSNFYNIDFIFEINRNQKKVQNSQQKSETIVLKKIQSQQFKDLIQVEDQIETLISQFIDKCLNDIDHILQGKFEKQPNDILYGIKNDQYLVSNTIYIKIHDRDGSNYKQLKSKVILQQQFFKFQFQKQVAVPLMCIIRANDFIFQCISQMPVQWVNNHNVENIIKIKLEKINNVKYFENPKNFASNIYENDYSDQFFPLYSMIDCGNLGIRFFQNFNRFLRPEFYQKKNSILFDCTKSSYFSDYLLIQECSYKLQRKIFSFLKKQQNVCNQNQQMDDFRSNIGNYFQNQLEPQEVIDFFENKFLNNIIISVQNYLEYFKTMTFDQFKSYIHFNGVNLKFIGYILQKLIRLQQNKQLIYFKDLLTTQILARTIKNIIIHNIWDYQKYQPVYNPPLNKPYQEYQDINQFLEEKINFFLDQINQIQNNKEKSFQNICFIKQIQKYFSFPNELQFKNLNINNESIKREVMQMIQNKYKNKFLVLKHTQIKYLSKQLISNYIFKPELLIEKKINIYKTFCQLVTSKSQYNITELNEDFQAAFGLVSFKTNLNLYQD